jgi:hypothetical protein
LLSLFAGNTIVSKVEHGPFRINPAEDPAGCHTEYTVQPDSVSTTSSLLQAQIRLFPATEVLLIKRSTEIHGIFRAILMVVTPSS